MRRVGVREFRDHATKYLAGSEPLTIERHGKPLGYYIPATWGGDEAERHAFDRLNETIEHVLKETGMTEDELSSLFDLSRPL